MSSTEFARVSITDAQPGDQILQAGEWVTLARVWFHGSWYGWEAVGGGSFSGMPVSHNPAVRRAVPKPSRSTTNLTALQRAGNALLAACANLTAAEYESADAALSHYLLGALAGSVGTKAWQQAVTAAEAHALEVVTRRRTYAHDRGDHGACSPADCATAHAAEFDALLPLTTATA